MISKERALEIGKAYLEKYAEISDKYVFRFLVKETKKKTSYIPLSTSLNFDLEVNELSEVRFDAYNAPRDNDWIIKYPRPIFEGLCSSYAILISKETGEIVYDGDACDEG